MARLDINPKSQPPTAQKAGQSTSADQFRDLLDRKRDLEARPTDTVGKNIQGGTADGALKEKLAAVNSDLTTLENETKAAQSYISENNSSFLKMSNDAFDSADQYFQDNQKSKLTSSLAIYHNKHPAGSVFSDGAGGLDWSSKVFRPKTRTVLNKFEADAAQAYFSNPDVVSIEAENPSDKSEVMAAEVMKSLLNYRLRKSLKWFHLCMGAFQDAIIQGQCVAYVDWVARYEDKDVDVQAIEIHPETGQPQVVNKTVTVKKKVEDRPRAELIAIDDLRFDPAADWEDIIRQVSLFDHPTSHVCVPGQGR
jgi:hypothetical protein